MRFFLISLAALLLISGCSLKTTRGLNVVDSDLSRIENVYFSNGVKPYIYRVSLAIYGKNQSGILIIKKTSEGHRLVFTTEFGSKIFDFEFIAADFNVNMIVEDMNKKIVLKTLEEDFRLLLKNTHQIAKQYTNGEFKVYQHVESKRFDFLFLTANGSLNKIVRTNAYKEKVTILFKNIVKTADGPTTAKRINIAHKNLKLNIELTYLEQ